LKLAVDLLLGMVLLFVNHMIKDAVKYCAYIRVVGFFVGFFFLQWSNSPVLIGWTVHRFLLRFAVNSSSQHALFPLYLIDNINLW